MKGEDKANFGHARILKAPKQIGCCFENCTTVPRKSSSTKDIYQAQPEN